MVASGESAERSMICWAYRGPRLACPNGPGLAVGATGDSSFVKSIIDRLRSISVVVEVLDAEGRLIGDSADLAGLLKSKPSPLQRVCLCNGGNVIVFDR